MPALRVIKGTAVTIIPIKDPQLAVCPMLSARLASITEAIRFAMLTPPLMPVLLTIRWLHT